MRSFRFCSTRHFSSKYAPALNERAPLRVQSLQFGAGQFYQMLGNGYQMKNLGAAPTIEIGLR